MRERCRALPLPGVDLRERMEQLDGVLHRATALDQRQQGVELVAGVGEPVVEERMADRQDLCGVPDTQRPHDHLEGSCLGENLLGVRRAQDAVHARLDGQRRGRRRTVADRRGEHGGLDCGGPGAYGIPSASTCFTASRSWTAARSAVSPSESSMAWT